MQSAAWLLVALPALGAVVLLLGGRRTDRWGHWLGCATVLAALGYGAALFAERDAGSPVTDVTLFDWMSVGSYQLSFGMRIDPLSLTFVLLITGVGFLIHLYSVGYLDHDPGRRRFFAYLNLFIAAMVVLVLADNLVVLYLGWEGVGVASYLLIGYYQDRPSAATAAKKAFLMNRVGDVGLALAIFLLWTNLGTVSYAGIFAETGGIADLAARSPGTVVAICLLLLLGACGKSGQFPLQSWLPDAMEGPTPVSALIHAATMVTAGVYLIARCNPIFDQSSSARLVVMIIGAVTITIGCIAGCAHDDLKKVLAYSTVSQIGYMILAVGLGTAGYALAIAHLLAHGFFKAGLFLGAGSVMHAMHDETDMRRFGGLWRQMPVTFATFGLGYLAIIGFPFLSGYFTKDAIIEASFAQSGWQGWVFGLVTVLGAFLTAFYMTRLMLMTFFGEARWAQLRTAAGDQLRPHEPGWVMTVPMVLLAVGSVGAGYVLVHGERLAGFLTPSLGELVEHHENAPLSAGAIVTLTLLLSVAGALLGWLAVGRRPVPLERPTRVSAPVAAARAGLYADAVNEALIARPGTWLTRALVFVDNRGVDGVVTGGAALLGGSSSRTRRLQTGFVRSYALGMLGGTVVIVAALLMVSST
ncbi:NADH-quinone oxidoreductase subunit L [Rhodococcus sp. X156]|uniref:NADH-quinone oxidoreductase subunit L n=1 Tax=Rhodococcus sp. X156 TaxID=2499145 RepID=UPI000FDB470A